VEDILAGNAIEFLLREWGKGAAMPSPEAGS
jgi:hypothetical protein